MSTIPPYHNNLAFTADDLKSGNVFFYDLAQQESQESTYARVKRELYQIDADEKAKGRSSSRAEISCMGKPNGYVRDRLVKEKFTVTVVHKPTRDCSCDGYGCSGNCPTKSVPYYAIGW